jgi:hypothetical protein
MFQHVLFVSLFFLTSIVCVWGGGGHKRQSAHYIFGVIVLPAHKPQLQFHFFSYMLQSLLPNRKWLIAYVGTTIMVYKDTRLNSQ